MKRFARRLVGVLAILLISAASADAAQAQDPYCTLAFTTAEIDYGQKQLRVIWLAEGTAAQVVLQLYQGGTIVDPDTNQDWRYYDVEAQQAVLNASNLHPGEFQLRAMMLDASQTPCKTHDGNPFVANAEMKWNPPTLQFKVFPNRPNYANDLISAQILIDGARQAVMYNAHLQIGGQLVGATNGIGSTNPFAIEISVPENVLNVKETQKASLVVEVGYSADDMTTVVTDLELAPAPDIGIMERFGGIVLAVLNNPPIVMAILLVFGVMVVFQSTHQSKKSPNSKHKQTDFSQQKPTGGTKTVEFHATPSVRARIIQNGDRTHEIVTNIDTFPFTFGRNKFQDHGQIVESPNGRFLNLRNDRAVSRDHFFLMRSGQQIGISVLSENGAKISGRTLGQSEITLISMTDPTEVEIGEQTKIELTPIYLT